jgi:hypothetical protein
MLHRILNMARNILIMPCNISLLRNILIMLHYILDMPRNILIMPCNILIMLRNILNMPLTFKSCRVTF